MRAFRSVLASFVFSACWQAAVAEPLVTDWPDLVDEAAQNFEDPFRDLTFDQLVALRTFVNAQESLTSGDTAEDDRSQLEAQLADVEAELKAEGIDANWLISQRWVVADRRKLAGEAGNPAKDGEIIKLGGFVIPAPAAEDGTPVGYLVPERGMCSHVPPPPPNQMVRLRLTNGWKSTEMYEPIVVTGQLQIQPSDERMMVVDGFVSMRATFEMDVTDVQTFSKNDVRQSVGTTDPSAATKTWAEGLAEKLKQNRQSQTENQ
ncbi:DUF3299 domain-containing protein [Ruegeria sp. HKCCA4707]|uniref:DUF3299 domain-containing protein n=1 Tax=Ruegeria sp. HKCCA4707 TaxID=2682984 RepID=UPI001487AAF8|nr:DUF3299 domain-containing protein [Ruegeria sp. HKCCA4707]